jgi:hypothetical protein
MNIDRELYDLCLKRKEAGWLQDICREGYFTAPDFESGTANVLMPGTIVHLREIDIMKIEPMLGPGRGYWGRTFRQIMKNMSAEMRDIDYNFVGIPDLDTVLNEIEERGYESQLGGSKEYDGLYRMTVKKIGSSVTTHIHADSRLKAALKALIAILEAK